MTLPLGDETAGLCRAIDFTERKPGSGVSAVTELDV
jgi:hypothetical protein